MPTTADSTRVLAGRIGGPARPSACRRFVASLFAASWFAGCGAFADEASRLSDAPDTPPAASAPVPRFASYGEALAAWAGPEDLSAWIGASFEYDRERALALSESQRAGRPDPRIIEPDAFYARPKGVCVDLARFAVEALKAVAPGQRPRYLMIEFDPARLQGQVLRRHWVAVVEGADGLRILADSKRPGVIAGPYRTIDEFLTEYAAFRGRDIVAHREMDSYAKRLRQRARRAQDEG